MYKIIFGNKYDFMKNSFFIVILLAFISLLQSSCGIQVYAPTTAQTPLFREKGETMASIHLGDGNELDHSFQIQGASAIDSHMAIFGSFYTAKGGFKHSNNSNTGKGSQLEIGWGYFNTLGNRISFEAYGGAGYGKATNTFQQNYEGEDGTHQHQSTIQNDFVKPFLQGNIGYRSPLFDAVVNMRIGYLIIGGLNETPSIDSGYVAIPNEDVIKIKSSPNSVLLEPGITFRAGYEPFKIQIHLGLSFNSNGDHYPQERFVSSIGFVGMLNSSTKRK